MRARHRLPFSTAKGAHPVLQSAEPEPECVGADTGCIGGGAYVCMNGDADEPGCVNRANKFLTRDIWDACRCAPNREAAPRTLCPRSDAERLSGRSYVINMCCGRKGVVAFNACGDYICFSQNPILQARSARSASVADSSAVRLWRPSFAHSTRRLPLARPPACLPSTP